MSSTRLPLLERLANAALFGAIGFAIALFAVPSGEPAYANTSVASPGYLFYSVRPGGNEKIYVCDTNNKTICVYTVENNNKLRLVSARKFDNDAKITDGARQVGNVRALESFNNGVDVKTAKVIGEAFENEKPVAKLP